MASPLCGGEKGIGQGHAALPTRTFVTEINAIQGRAQTQRRTVSALKLSGPQLLLPGALLGDVPRAGCTGVLCSAQAWSLCHQAELSTGHTEGNHEVSNTPAGINETQQPSCPRGW